MKSQVELKLQDFEDLLYMLITGICSLCLIFYAADIDSTTHFVHWELFLQQLLDQCTMRNCYFWERYWPQSCLWMFRFFLLRKQFSRSAKLSAALQFCCSAHAEQQCLDGSKFCNKLQVDSPSEDWRPDTWSTWLAYHLHFADNIVCHVNRPC